MTKFNPDGKEQLTYGESLGPAMAIIEQADADQYFVAYVALIQRYLDAEPLKNGKTAEEIAKINLGYYAGYYDSDTRARVERLYQCAHPVFGSIEKKGPPTTEQAFAYGFKYAKGAQ